MKRDTYTKPQYIGPTRSIRNYTKIQAHARTHASYVLLPAWYHLPEGTRVFLHNGRTLTSTPGVNSVECPVASLRRGRGPRGWRVTLPAELYEQGMRVVEWRLPRHGVYRGTLRAAPRWTGLPLSIEVQELLIDSGLDPTPELVEYLRMATFKEQFTVAKVIAAARALQEINTSHP